MTFKGSCHCGTVAYEVDEIEAPVGHCHCVTCRKTHSAAFTTTARVAHERFRWLSGEDRLTAYESSPGKKRYFCSMCGCHIVAIRDPGTFVILRVATLDDDPGLRPEFHIWRAHDVPWLADSPELASYEEWPPHRK